MVYVLYMTSPESLEAAGFVQVFQRAAPAAYLDRLSLEHGLTVRRGFYSLAAVIWLMIFQRLIHSGALREIKMISVLITNPIDKLLRVINTSPTHGMEKVYVEPRQAS